MSPWRRWTKKKIKTCLSNVITTGKFSVPKYSFLLGRPEGEERCFEIGTHDIVIVEGIHGLNPIFTKELPRGKLHQALCQRQAAD